MQEFYHEFLLKLHNGRISLARLTKLVDKVWGLVKIMTIEIWQSRNNHKCDKKLLPQQAIINKINAQLKIMIPAYYKKHKLNDTLDIFQNQFCINEALAKIENNIIDNNSVAYGKLSRKLASRDYCPYTGRNYVLSQIEKDRYCESKEEGEYGAPLLKGSERRLRAHMRKQEGQTLLTLTNSEKRCNYLKNECRHKVIQIALFGKPFQNIYKSKGTLLTRMCPL